MNAPTNGWHKVGNIADVPSPALLIYTERVAENLRRMIQMARDLRRLRPHVKTHKLGEIVRLQLGMGITRFKCATVAEAEMAAGCGAADVLLAYQPVGPNVRRLVELSRAFPGTKFSCVADDANVIRSLSAACVSSGVTMDVLLDVDCGMHRTGVVPGSKAVDLYRLITQSRGLKAGGLHAYDGHIHNSGVSERTLICDAAFAAVSGLKQDLVKGGLPVPRIVAGGTPTFPVHAARPEVECSPGTCVLWDFGYAAKLPDLDFLPAALVLSRVVSKPGLNRLCLDLGHKAIAAENPPPRVQFLGLADANPTTHSEEHLVLETPRANEFAVGDCLYGVPRHVCPTVALYAEAVAIEKNQAVARWTIARNRAITI